MRVSRLKSAPSRVHVPGQSRENQRGGDTFRAGQLDSMLEGAAYVRMGVVSHWRSRSRSFAAF